MWAHTVGQLGKLQTSLNETMMRSKRAKPHADMPGPGKGKVATCYDGHIAYAGWQQCISKPVLVRIASAASATISRMSQLKSQLQVEVAREKCLRPEGKEQHKYIQPLMAIQHTVKQRHWIARCGIPQAASKGTLRTCCHAH